MPQSSIASSIIGEIESEKGSASSIIKDIENEKIKGDSSSIIAEIEKGKGISPLKKLSSEKELTEAVERGTGLPLPEGLTDLAGASEAIASVSSGLFYGTLGYGTAAFMDLGNILLLQENQNRHDFAMQIGREISGLAYKPQTEEGGKATQSIGMPIEKGEGVIRKGLSTALQNAGFSQKDSERYTQNVIDGMWEGLSVIPAIKGVAMKYTPQIGESYAKATPEMAEAKPTPPASAISPIERIESPALLVDGKIIRGSTHIEALDRAAKELNLTPEEMAQKIGTGDDNYLVPDGYVTSDGRFVDRKEAVRIDNLSRNPQLVSDGIENFQQSLSGEPAQNAGFMQTLQDINESMGEKGGIDIGSVNDFLSQSKKEKKYSGNLLDDYYILKNKGEIDRILSRRVLQEAKGSSADYEAIYNWIENPKEPITPEQRAIYKSEIEPIRIEREKIFSKLRNEGVPVEGQSTYTPRQVANKGGFYERLKEGYRRMSTGGMLSVSTGELKKRSMMAIEDEAGHRQVVSIDNNKVTSWDKGNPSDMGSIKFTDMEEMLNQELSPVEKKVAKIEREMENIEAAQNREWKYRDHLKEHNRKLKLEELEKQKKEILEGYDPATLNDKLFKDKDGSTWKITQATTKEIEANTNLTYHKNVLINELLAYNNLKRVERNIEYLDNLKTDPEFSRVAIKVGTQNIPKDYRTTDLPQLKGYAFPKRIAEVFDDFYKKASTGLMDSESAYAHINRFLRNAIFFNPLIHIPNITIHGIVHRGLMGTLKSWAMPEDLIVSSHKAIEAVLTMNDDYIAAMEKGAPMLYSEIVNKDFNKLMLEKIGSELSQDAKRGKELSDIFGYANPAELVKKIYNFSSESTWAVNDIVILQAVYEEMAHGKTMEAAIADVGKHIPNYRVPPRILGSRTIAKLMRADSGVTMFGAYHYGALKSYWEMAKSLVEKVPLSERAEALDKLAMIGIAMYVVYPEADKVAKLAMDNENSKFRRAGATTFPYKTTQLAQGKIRFSDWIQTIMTPSVGFQLGTEMMTGRDWHSGKRFRSYPETMLRSISPVGYGERIAEGELDVREFLGSLAGISSPRTPEPDTPAEIRARNLRQMQMEGEPTHEQRQHTRLKQNLVKEAKKGNVGAIQDAQAEGLITKQEAIKMTGHYDEEALIHYFSMLTPEDALEVFEAATPEQKEILHPMMQMKLMRNKSLSPEKKEALRDALDTNP